MDCKIIDLGLIEYQECYTLQKKMHKQRQAGSISDVLLLLEHPLVITKGRSSSGKNILADTYRLAERNIRIINADRGGDVTIHLPGQLVAYPIFDLKNFKKDIHFFVCSLEEVILGFLSAYGIKGRRKKGFPGVWIKEEKAGFIGLGISKWISFHGISVNVNCELENFFLIKPCGFESSSITSVENVLRQKVDFKQAKLNLISAFKNCFKHSHYDEIPA